MEGRPDLDVAKTAGPPRRVARRVTFYIAGLGVLLTLALWLSGRPEWAEGSAAGAALALVNWLLMQWIVGRVIGGAVQRQAGLMLVLVAKMGALMALVYALIRYEVVHAPGFLVGLGALFGGVIVGSLHQLLSGKPAEGRSDASR